MNRKHIAAAALVALFTTPAFAHHPSPAEPDIGDMQGMHESAIESMLETTSRAFDLEEVRSDNVGSGIDNGGSSD